MTHYIGATGLDIFEDAITEAIDDLTTLIITQDNLQAGYTSNYVLSTSNILVKRITDEVDFTSNYVLSTSNILIGRISDTSNYVLSTSNILVERTKQLEDRVDDLEGTEGSAGDPEADPPIPPIPPTGNFAILATLATLTAGASALAIVVADLTDDVNVLDDKVDLNDIYTSNYVKITSNILVKRITDEVGFGSNYVLNTSNILVKRITDEVGYTSNYVLSTSNILVKRITDEVGFTSNYVLNTSNILVKRITDEVGFGSNYVLSTSNILVKRITDEVKDTSNYVERLTTGLGANYWTEESTNNIYLNKSGNVGIGTQTSLTNKLQVQGTISASGLITGNAGLTIPSGQTLTSSGTLTASVINASGLITGNAGLTIPSGQTLTSSGTLTASVINASGLITGNAGITIPSGQTLTSSGTLTASVINASGLITRTNATTGTSDSLNIQYDTRNGIRIQQRYIGTDDVRYDLIQKVANVDKTASLTLYDGKVGIGRTDPTNILQVGLGNRLRISNNNTDFTIIGTGDTPELHTRIFMGGINYTEPFFGGTGNIYYFSGNGGKHLFLTQTTTTETERMRIGNNGNVAIGTTDTATYKLNLNGSQFVNNQLVFNNGYKGGGGADYACNKIYLYGGGNTPTTTSAVGEAFGFGVAAGGLLEYFTYNNHAFYTGTTGGTNYGTERLRIYGNGAVGIQGTGNWGIAQGMTAGSLTIGNITQNYGGQSGAVANMAGLMMECSDNTEIAIHDSNTAVYSFMRYTTNGNFRIGRDMGWGAANLYITGALLCNSYIESDATILSKNAVYARNSFDTRIRSDSGGMFLEMGTIGSEGDLLRFGAYANATNIDSGGTRPIYMRTNGQVWAFSSLGPCYNAKNISTWDIGSDHRIKEDIKKANLKICYNNVKNINLYRFKYIDGFKEATKHDRTQLGYIAQQVQKHFPKSVQRSKTRIEDKREIPDFASVDVSQVNYTLFGAVKQLMRIVEKQSKRIKKLEEMLNIIDDDNDNEVEDDADEPYVRMNCEDEVDIDDIEPSEPVGV